MHFARRGIWLDGRECSDWEEESIRVLQGWDVIKNAVSPPMGSSNARSSNVMGTRPTVSGFKPPFKKHEPNDP